MHKNTVLIVGILLAIIFQDISAEGELSAVHLGISANPIGFDGSVSLIEGSIIIPWLWLGVGSNLFTVTQSFDGYSLSDRGKQRVFEYPDRDFLQQGDTVWIQMTYYRSMQSWFPIQLYWVPLAYLSDQKLPYYISVQAFYCPWTKLGGTGSFPGVKDRTGNNTVLDIGVRLNIPFASLIAGYNVHTIKESIYIPGDREEYYPFVHVLPYTVSRVYIGVDFSLGKTFLGTKRFLNQFFLGAHGWIPPPVWESIQSEVKTAKANHGHIGKACEILIQEKLNERVVDEIIAMLGRSNSSGADDSIIQFAIDHPIAEDGARILGVMRLRKSREVLEALFRKNAFSTMNRVVSSYAFGFINGSFSNDNKVRDPNNAGLLDSVIVVCLQNASDTNLIQASYEGFIHRTPMILKNGINRIMPALESLSAKSSDRCRRILLEISQKDVDPEYFRNLISLSLLKKLHEPLEKLCRRFIVSHPLEAKEFLLQEMFMDQSANKIIEIILSEYVDIGDFAKVKKCVEELAPTNPPRCVVFLELCKKMEGPAVKEFLLSLINSSYDKRIIDRAVAIVRNRLTQSDASAIIGLIKTKDIHLKTIGIDLISPFIDNGIIDELLPLAMDTDNKLAHNVIGIIAARGNASQILKLTVLFCKPTAKNNGFALNLLDKRLDNDTTSFQNASNISGSDFSNFKDCLLESVDKSEKNKYVTLLKMCQKMRGYEADILYREAKARREVSVWKVSQAKGALNSYAEYLGEFPDGRRRKEAEMRLDEAVFSIKKPADFGHVLALTGTIIGAYTRTGINVDGPNGGIRESFGTTDFVFGLKDYTESHFQMTMEAANETGLVVRKMVGDNLYVSSVACEGSRARVYYLKKGDGYQAIFAVKLNNM